MKTVTKMMFSVAALFAAGTMAVQAQCFNKAADWKKAAAISDGNGVLVVNGKTMMRGKTTFTVDPSKTYTIKYSVSAPNGKAVWILGGFLVYDKKGRSLSSTYCNVVANTQTVIAADAKKGATSVLVKDASKFRKGSYAIVSGAKADLSDLPNFNVLSSGIKSVVKKGNAWEVTFNRPIVKDIKAGTAVRLHALGGYIYTAGSKYINQKWVTMSGSIKGIKPGTWQGNVWPAGTAKAELIILADWTNKNTKVEFKDITLTVK